MNRQELNTVIQELKMYTEISNDEWQEAMDLLIQAVRYSYIYSDEFTNLLVKELTDNLENCKKNATIHEETITESHTYTVKTLEWD